MGTPFYTIIDGKLAQQAIFSYLKEAGTPVLELENKDDVVPDKDSVHLIAIEQDEKMKLTGMYEPDEEELKELNAEKLSNSDFIQKLHPDYQPKVISRKKKKW